MSDNTINAIFWAGSFAAMLIAWAATATAFARRARHVVRGAVAASALTPAVVSAHSIDPPVPAWWIVYAARAVPEWWSCLLAVLLLGVAFGASRLLEGRSMRFGLRTLFVLVTAACLVAGYVTYQWRIVIERNTVRVLLEKVHDQDLLVLDDKLLSIGGVLWVEHQPVPWFRRMLGDRPLEDNYFLPKDEALRQRALNAFPEEPVIPWPARP